MLIFDEHKIISHWILLGDLSEEVSSSPKRNFKKMVKGKKTKLYSCSHFSCLELILSLFLCFETSIHHLLMNSQTALCRLSSWNMMRNPSLQTFGSLEPLRKRYAFSNIEKSCLEENPNSSFFFIYNFWEYSSK